MIEHSLAFGEANGLIGTILTPSPTTANANANTNAPDVGFILFNAGVVHRVGVHRTNVKLARQLAGDGFASIRFDLAGVGDSARGSGKHAFAEQAVVDIRAAMDALSAATGVKKFVLFGACSGTVHSFAAARVDERIVGLAMFDTYVYHTVKSRLRYIGVRIKKHGSLSKFASRVAAVIVQVVRAKLRPAKDSHAAYAADGDFAFDIGKPEFISLLNTLLDKQIKILLIYAGSGYVHYNYEHQFRDAFKSTGIVERLSTVYIRDIDHTATRVASQRDLVDCVQQWSKRFLTRSP
jgi:pimeloyl-ACP methyl ester carboxylesterase